MGFLLRVGARWRSRARLRFVGRGAPAVAGLGPLIEQIQELVGVRLLVGTARRSSGLVVGDGGLARTARFGGPITGTTGRRGAWTIAATALGRRPVCRTAVACTAVAVQGRCLWSTCRLCARFFRRRGGRRCRDSRGSFIGRTRRRRWTGRSVCASGAVGRSLARRVFQCALLALCLFVLFALINQPPQRRRDDKAGDDGHPNKPATTRPDRRQRVPARRVRHWMQRAAGKAGLAAAVLRAVSRRRCGPARWQGSRARMHLGRAVPDGGLRHSGMQAGPRRSHACLGAAASGSPRAGSAA